MMFQCIYCLRTEPDVEASESHIIPVALGGSETSNQTVCKDCNNLIGIEVENKSIPKFSFFRNILGIGGRRGKIPRIRATFFFDGVEKDVWLDDKGEPEHPIVIKETTQSGDKEYRIIGSSEESAKIRENISKKKPEMKWEDIETTGKEPPKAKHSVTIDPSSILLRRLAAKVAFETWAKKRGSSLLVDRQYDPVRDFILNGVDQDARCGVIADPSITPGLDNIPVGNHVVAIIQHPSSQILGSFVLLFGLLYYYVLLSTSFVSLKADDIFVLENPQTEETDTPLLRLQTGDILINWDAIRNDYRNDPENVHQKAREYAAKKLADAMSEA